MPFVHGRDLFFIHVPKTAGSAIELAFGIKSVATAQPTIDKPVTRAFRTIKNKFSFLRFKSHQPRNVLSSNLFGYTDHPLVTQHLTLSELYWLGFLTQNEICSSQFFAVVRHPVERIKSAWRSHYRSLQFPNINDFVKSRLSLNSEKSHDELAHIRPMSHFVDSSMIPCMVNIHILRFEYLASDWHDFSSMLTKDSRFSSLSLSKLPRLPSNALPESISSNEELTSDSIQLIKQFYKVDFEQFNYRDSL